MKRRSRKAKTASTKTHARRNPRRATASRAKRRAHRGYARGPTVVVANPSTHLAHSASRPRRRRVRRVAAASAKRHYRRNPRRNPEMGKAMIGVTAIATVGAAIGAQFGVDQLAVSKIAKLGISAALGAVGTVGLLLMGRSYHLAAGAVMGATAKDLSDRGRELYADYEAQAKLDASKNADPSLTKKTLDTTAPGMGRVLSGATRDVLSNRPIGMGALPPSARLYSAGRAASVRMSG